jgi:hypothetical protein
MVRMSTQRQSPSRELKFFSKDVDDLVFGRYTQSTNPFEEQRIESIKEECADFDKLVDASLRGLLFAANL